MKLTALDRSKLPGMEHYQYAGHVLRMCKEAGVEKLTAVLKPLEDALNREDEALNYPRSKEGSKELDTLDSVRDTAYRALMKALEAALATWNGTLLVASHDRWLVAHWSGPRLRLTSAPQDHRPMTRADEPRMQPRRGDVHETRTRIG